MDNRPMNVLIWYVMHDFFNTMVVFYHKSLAILAATGYHTSLMPAAGSIPYTVSLAQSQSIFQADV